MMKLKITRQTSLFGHLDINKKSQNKILLLQKKQEEGEVRSSSKSYVFVMNIINFNTIDKNYNL